MAMATAADARTDAQIQRDVLAELEWDARVRPNEIGVAVKDCVVTLLGWAVRHLIGVRGVINQIAVKPPSIPSGLKENIEEALRPNAHAAAARITVGVQGEG